MKQYSEQKIVHSPKLCVQKKLFVSVEGVEGGKRGITQILYYKLEEEKTNALIIYLHLF